MSTEEGDWLADQARSDIEREFTVGLLQSYYRRFPDVLSPALRSLEIAYAMGEEHPEAVVVFSAASVEISIKRGIIRPVVFGLVHDDAAAEVIMQMTSQSIGLERYKGILSAILAKYAGMDLDSLRPAGAKQGLWKSMLAVQGWRNNILHEGKPATVDEAREAAEVAYQIIGSMFPSLIRHLEMHLHSGMRVCGSAAPFCNETDRWSPPVS